MNGTAIALTIARDPVQPAKALDERIGAATASAAAAIAMGMADFAACEQISPGIKALGGKALAEVARLQLDYDDGEAAFAALARREGRKAFELQYGTALRSQLGAKKVDIAIDDLIDRVLLIVGLVVDDERALRTN
jgi:hypothetical protein